MPKPLNFNMIEELRKLMLLSTSQMAEILGTTRASYYQWRKGKPIRQSNQEKAVKGVRALLAIVSEYEWPTPEVKGMTSEARYKKLKELLDEIREPVA